MAVGLVAGPPKCALRRGRAIDSNDDAVGSPAARCSSHHDDRTRAVPDNVTWSAAEPEGSCSVVSARTDDDQVVRTGTFDQGI